MPELLLGEWNCYPPLKDDDHVEVVYELMSYHSRCRHCTRLQIDVNTGGVSELMENSALHWSRVFEWPWVLRHAELSPFLNVLEAGGGHSVLQYALAARVASVTNVDLGRESLAAVAPMMKKLGLANIQPVLADLLNLPAAFDDKFDRVVCVSVVEHLGDRWWDAVDALFRVLKPGGLLLLTMDITWDACGTEFTIDADRLREFLGRYGKGIPEGEKVLKQQMDDGSLLSCLALKFRK